MLMAVPVPATCVHQVAHKYGVPSAVIYAMLKVEGGHPGQAHRNADGSYDYGPMQINGRWFTTKKSVLQRRFPFLEASAIKKDPCVNTDVGGWILYEEWRQSAAHCFSWRHPRACVRKSLWSAVGHYHSHNKTESAKYVHRVYSWYTRIIHYWNRRYGYPYQRYASR